MDGRERCWAVTDWTMEKSFWEGKRGKLKYCIMGEEIAPSTGKLHWQGFMILKDRMSDNAVKKFLEGRHGEMMYEDSSIEANQVYCKKGNKIVLEFGKAPKGRGHRTDMEDLRDMIVQRVPLRDIFEEMPGQFIRYNRGIERAYDMYEQKRNWEMDVRIYWGAPGTGKTRSVHDEFGDDLYVKMNGKWWDDYKGETCVLIDDFDPENCFDSTFDWYLKLLDRYQMKVEYKGGSCQFRSKVIIFTSNFEPDEWFVNKKNRQAFFRRVKSIREF